MMVLSAATWGTLLLVGFALLAWPALGSSIRTSSGTTPTDFMSALYNSGHSLTTLGTGDIVPRTSVFRLQPSSAGTRLRRRSTACRAVRATLRKS